MSSHKFEEKLSALGIVLDDRQKEQFDLFYEILVEWNEFMNLTGITEYEEVNEKHFVDSVSIVKALDMKSVKSVIDVGTGAGFPGIPLKIVFPELEVVLLDSLNKRVKFLNAVIEKLQLKGIRAIHGEQKTMQSSRNTENSLISVCPEQWQIWQHCQNIAFHM